MRSPTALLFVCAVLSGCECSNTASPAPAPAPTPSPEVAAEPAAPIAPPPPITRCAIEPAGGLVLATNRGWPQLRLGRSGGVVVHTMETNDGYGHSPDHMCWSNPGVVSFGELASPTDLVAVRDGVCNDDVRDGELPFLDVDGEVGVLECARLGSARAECAIRAPFSPTVDGLAFVPPITFTSSSSIAVASADGVAFVVAPDGERLLGWVLARAGNAEGVLVPELSSLGRAANEYRARVALDGESARVTLVSSWGETFTLHMDAHAQPDGPPQPGETAPTSPPTADPALTRAIALVNTTPDQYSPSFPSTVEVGDRQIAVWQSDGESPQIRLAIFDPASGELISEIVDVSADGHRVAGQDLARAGDRTVVVWEERDDASWVIRGADVRCSP